MRKLIACIAVAAGVLLGMGSAAAATKVTICSLPFVSDSPLFIAADKGYFAKQGLTPEFKIFHAAQPIAVGVASGDCDFGVTGFTAGFFNLAGKGALKVIGAQSREEPGYQFVGFVASNKAWNNGLHSIKQLPGHTVGVTQIGSTFYYNLAMLSEKFGWKLDSIHIKPLQSVPAMISAVKGGQVDAIAIPAHIIAALRKKDAVKLLGWVSDYTPWQLGGLFTSSSLVNNHPDQVRAFVRAYQEGASEYHDAFNRRNAQGQRVFGEKAKALIPIIQKYTHASTAAIYKGAPYIDPHGRLKVDSIYREVKWFQRHGMVDASVDPHRFLDLGFIKGQ